MKLIYQKEEKEEEIQKGKQPAFYEIYINEEHEYFYINTGGDINQEFHKVTNLQLLAEIETYKYSRIMFNLSQQKSTEVKSRIWFVSYVTKKAYEILRDRKIYAAVVNSSNPLEKAVTNILMRSIARFKSNINFQLFDVTESEKAKEWIIESKNKNSLLN